MAKQSQSSDQDLQFELHDELSAMQMKLEEVCISVCSVQSE